MIYLFFFGSGLSALLYQVAWTRAAGLALGNTTAAAGTVVAVFMAGLAAGSAWAGRAAARVRPLRLYGALEIAVGALGLAVPFLFRATAPLQALAYDTPFFPAVRIVTCAVLLLPATFLMGATLPLLVQHLDRPEGPGRLYAVNSLGAALGALAAGLLLVPRLGLVASTAVAAAINFAIGVASFRMGARAPAPARDPAPAAPLTRPQKLAVAVYAASGFAALVCEMAWTRAFTLAFGSTVYAFSIVLFCFILGLALGSALAARRAASLQDPVETAAVLQLLIAVWNAALLYLLADLPLHVMDLLLILKPGFLGLQLVELLLVALLVVAPTMMMGALLPVVLGAFRPLDPARGKPGGSDARAVGRVYAANTAAAIAGTLAGSFLLLPALGIDATLRVAGAVNVAAAVAALALGAASPPRKKLALWAAGAAVALVTLLLPRWEARVSASGAYLYASVLDRASLSEGKSVGDVLRSTVLEAAYWDAFGLVTVHRTQEGELTLRVNGKTDASTLRGDMPAQTLTAQIPLVLHPDPRDVLVIGLGSGITLANAQSHAPASVDCVEISPAVLRAARHFADANGGALDRPGTRVLLNDGRAHVRYARKSYDVVVSEPSNLWVSGMANLFTLDFFREVRSRLRPGGVFAQWVHAYRLSTDDFKGVLRTFLDVFPHATFWEMATQGDYLVLGEIEPRKPRWEEVEGRLRRPEVARRLAAAGISDATGFLASYLFGPRELAALAAGGRPITDDLCWIESTAPFSMMRVTVSELHPLMAPLRRSAAELLDAASLPEAERAALDRFFQGRKLLAEAVSAVASSDLPLFRRKIDAAGDLNPADRQIADLAEQQGKGAYQRAFEFQASGQLDPALRMAKAVPTRSSFHAKALWLEGWVTVRSGRPADARPFFEAALGADPKLTAARLNLAQVDEFQGKMPEARAHLERALLDDPGNVSVHVAWARFLSRRGEKAQAKAAVVEALRRHPGDPDLLKLLAALGL